MRQIMMNVTAAMIFVATLSGGHLFGENLRSTEPLADLARLAGSRWSSSDSVTEIEWGVDRKTVRAKTYFNVEGRETLMAEGLWFWNPEANAIKGYVIATGMPFEILDMTTHFEGDMLVSDLRAIDANGVVSDYQETWDFTSDDEYVWTLYSVSDEGKAKSMEGRYVRVSD